MKIAVIGAGAWGTTLAVLLAAKGHSIKLWIYEADLIEEIRKTRENKKFLAGIKLPLNIEIISDIKDSAGSEIIFFTAPTQHLRKTASGLNGLFNKETILVSASKGIEIVTLKRPSQIIEEELQTCNIVVLSGPNLSKEIAKGLPAATVVACESPEISKTVQEILTSERFRVYRSPDVIGVELGGALKNIIALAAGIADGLKLGDNAKAALIVRGIVEIERLGVALGGKPSTFYGLSGIGDLIVTCSSALSRNHCVGTELAKGKSLPEITKDMLEVAEGILTTKAACELAKKYNVEMPITFEVYKVLFEEKAPHQALTDLMTRQSKEEK